jgi:hypothetical protein
VQEGAEDGRTNALEARLRRELGGDADRVPAPPPPARPPGGLELLRARASVWIWRARAAVPESMKRPLRKLLGRPSPVELAAPEGPSDISRLLEDVQIGQVELARRVTELEERLMAIENSRTEKP